MRQFPQDKWYSHFDVSLFISADPTGGFKGPVKKEPEMQAPLNSSALDVKTSDTTEIFSATMYVLLIGSIYDS